MILFKSRLVLFALMSYAFLSCGEEDVVVEGMSAVYISSTDFTKVYSTDTVDFKDLGNIILSGQYIFVNERYEGIHVIDNSNPLKPIKKHFWKIPGNLEFTLVGKTLYADNSVHLLVIDISDFSNIKVINYIKDLYIENPPKEPRPPGYKGMFTCVDKKNGIHIGGEMKMIVNPLCEAY
ncbi:MAG: hypothetical protein ACM3PT_02025 [Deltaproteobacteria bacterium]